MTLPDESESSPPFSIEIQKCTSNQTWNSYTYVLPAFYVNQALDDEIGGYTYGKLTPTPIGETKDINDLSSV